MDENNDKKLLYLTGTNVTPKSGLYFFTSRMIESFNLHMHDFYELEIVTSGSCGEYLNGNYFEISVGDICVITPFDIHNFVLPDTGGHVETFGIHFYQRLISENIRACLERITMPLVPKVNPAQYQLLFSIAMRAREELLSENAFRNAAAEHLLCSMLCMLLGMDNTFGTTAQNEKSRISSALGYISENYSHDISLEDVADKLSISVYYLSSLFNETLGKGFREILNLYRLRQVTNELLSTQKSITDICYDAGYQNFSHFSRVFKEHFGMSPSQYRKQTDGKIVL